MEAWLESGGIKSPKKPLKIPYDETRKNDRQDRKKALPVDASPSETPEAWSGIFDKLRQANEGAEWGTVGFEHDLEAQAKAMKGQKIPNREGGRVLKTDEITPDELNAIAAALEEPTGLLDYTFEPKNLLEMSDEEYDAWEEKQASEEDPENPTFFEGKRT